MKIRSTCLTLAFVAGASCALAADGLVAPAAETVWPQWQARISVQAASVSPLTVSGLVDGPNAQRGLQGAALLGDYYYFRSATLGGFRASGGLLSGAWGGLPLVNGSAGPRLGLSVTGVALPLNAPYGDIATLPYLGLGYSSPARGGALSVTADLGLVAGHPGGAVGVGRAIFGNQAMDTALRELRVSPVLQLGVRYTF